MSLVCATGARALLPIVSTQRYWKKRVLINKMDLLSFRLIRTKGSLFLATKTVERAHTPSSLWERVQLSADYAQALDQITKSLNHW